MRSVVPSSQYAVLAALFMLLHAACWATCSNCLFIQALCTAGAQHMCTGCHVAPEMPSFVKLFVKHRKCSAGSPHNITQSQYYLCCDALAAQTAGHPASCW